MLSERRRAFRLLRERSLGTFWLARLLERLADWMILLTLLVAAWNRTTDAGVAASALAVWIAPRLVISVLYEGWARRLPALAGPLLMSARAAAVIFFLVAASFNVLAEPELILGTAGLIGFVSALSGGAREQALRNRLNLTDLGAGAAADALVERAAAFAGAGTAGVLLTLGEPVNAAVVAAGAFGIAAVLGFAGHSRLAGAPARSARASTHATSAPLDAAEARFVARSTAIYLVAAFTTGALGAVLIIAALPLPSGRALGSAAFAPILVALGGLGMLLGPLPVPRLLLRVPAPLLLLATVTVTAAVALSIVVSRSTPIAIVALMIFGLTVATQDSLRSICLRRLAPVAFLERANRLSMLALAIGQVYGLLAVISIASRDPFAVLVFLSVSQVLLVALAIALGGRSSLQVGGLSSLPIKSVVHKLSWDTRPAAVAQAFEGKEPRVQRLARWINRQVTLERLTVSLPVSKREYEIYRPDEASRERLFEQGRADPEKQRPYWAKVWPSGVALADLVVERKIEVTDKHVLELGAGLGVTACAILEYGGHLVTADYSALPLAHCRLNTLFNTERSPRATCFNWRHDTEVAAAGATQEFAHGFPLIIAGDVLYEGRDAEPLLNVIERLLVADGSLWLAEPVRRTAQRFLDSAAALGWEIESRQVKADWPDATDGPVNLHFLTRSPEPDRVIADLGGWRI